MAMASSASPHCPCHSSPAPSPFSTVTKTGILPSRARFHSLATVPFSPKLYHHHLFPSFSSGTNGRALAVSSSLDGISVGFPKPEVIEWQKDLSNTVSLIGTLGNNVVIKYLDSGKVMAHCIIKVKRSGISASKDDSV